MNLAAAHWKMRKKNEILPSLQSRFEESVAEGKLLSLEAGADDWLAELVQDLDA